MEEVADSMNPAPKPEPGHRPKRRVKVSIPERDLQGMAEDLCNAAGIRFFRIPDKLLSFLKLYAPQWVRVFTARYFAGVPDMMLFKALPNGRNEVVFLEIKTEAGKVSPNQRSWHAGLHVKIAYGWEEVKQVITEFVQSVLT